MSELIENYLNSISKPISTRGKISPLVESLTGVIPDENKDERKDYLNRNIKNIEVNKK